MNGSQNIQLGLDLYRWDLFEGRYKFKIWAYCIILRRPEAFAPRHFSSAKLLLQFIPLGSSLVYGAETDHCAVHRSSNAVTRAFATLRSLPVDVLTRILDVACLAVNAAGEKQVSTE